MAVNADKPHLWKQDIAHSVDFYNSWFMEFAPTAYRNTRIATTQQVESALTWTANLTNITPAVLRQHPSVLPILRMATAPPIARVREACAIAHSSHRSSWSSTEPCQKHGREKPNSTSDEYCHSRC